MLNILDPAILFFVLGVFAGIVRSNLEIPRAIARFLSLYLLMALGLKGGFALSHSGFSVDVAKGLGLAIALALLVPMLAYRLLSRLVPSLDAVAIAATYGSVSAVTFATTVQFLETRGVVYGGHMAAAMALMESPAIVLGVVWANLIRRQAGPAALPMTSARIEVIHPKAVSLRAVLHEALTDGTQLVLLASLLIGLATGEEGKKAMQPFSGDLFKGMLAFFLLDMGLMVSRNVGALRHVSPLVIAYAIVGPLAHAGIALAGSQLLSLPMGDTTLLMALAASASYIAVPAVLRYAIPEAQPSLYFGLSIGITFPLNILLGIPLYAWAAGHTGF